MSPREAYAWLMDGPAPVGCDAFARHVAASILAIAVSECEHGAGLAGAAGLTQKHMRQVADWAFPHAGEALCALAQDNGHAANSEEQAVRDILLMYASGHDGLDTLFAAMVARRCQKPNHLWQDLGLNDRGELSRLMRERFASLARRNNQDMKWKKFLYRMVCGNDGFRLCTAPVCTECGDFDDCFGDETGESFLARARLASTADVVAAE